MKSVRLTIEKREKLINYILEKAFGKQKKDLKVLWTKFSDDCYDAMYSKEERDYMTNDPNKKNAYKWCSRIVNCYFNGQNFYTWRHAYIDNTMSETKPFWNITSEPRRCFDKDHALTKRYIKLCTKSSALDDEVKALRSEIKAIVNAATTTKNLIVNWPEAEGFLAASGIMKKPVAPVPMKRPDALNEKLCVLIGKKSPTCKGL